MHVLISADMEGVLASPARRTCTGHGALGVFRAMLTGDVNAAVAGFFEAGADQVTVNEGGLR